MRPAQLEHPDFDLGGHLVGTPRRPMGAVGQTLPSVSYRANQRCTVRRLTPRWLATSITARPSERTPRTAWYRCSVMLSSLMGESETHQPK